MSFESIPK